MDLARRSAPFSSLASMPRQVSAAAMALRATCSPSSTALCAGSVLGQAATPTDMAGSSSDMAPRKPSPPVKPVGVMTPVNEVLPITGTPGSSCVSSSSIAGMSQAQLA